MTTMRLEFSESQQHFHLANLSVKENTFGWVTIAEHNEYILTLFISHTEYCCEKPFTIKMLKKNYSYFLESLQFAFYGI